MALLSRRRFLVGAGALSAISPKSSPAQQAKAPTVGWLASGHTANTLPAAFRAALRDLGYTEGRSIRIEARWAEGNSEKLRELARDLVRQPVDVIVSNGRGATRAAQEATAAIPVVMAPVDDPYEFVASLSRPSGNITGLALQQTEIDAKQIEMLKEIAPQLSRLAILYYYGETYYALESIAHALGIEVLWIAIKGASDVENAFAEAQVKKANGLLIVDTGALGVT
jgi:putative ABC transport system substrate-binding protein